MQEARRHHPPFCLVRVPDGEKTLPLGSLETGETSVPESSEFPFRIFGKSGSD